MNLLRPHQRAASRVIQIVASVSCAVWLLTIASRILTAVTDPGARAIVFAMILVAPTALLSRRFSVVAPIALGSAPILILSLSEPSPTRTLAAALLGPVAMASAAVLTRPGPFLSCLVGIITVQVVAISLVAGGFISSTESIALLSRGAATALVVFWVLQAIRTTAAAWDRIAVYQLDVELQATVERQNREARAEAARTLHDTCVNTLGAISLGVVTQEVTSLRQRCRLDLAQMDALEAEHAMPKAASVADVIDRAIRRAELVGLKVDLLSHVGDVTPPARVGAALSGALAETLTNIAKHARTESAMIYASAGQDGFRVVVADFGQGFDPGHTQYRGISHSVLARTQRVGFTTEIRSTPGRGTTVSFDWQDDQAEVVPESPPADPIEIVVPLARKIILAFSACVLIQAALAIPNLVGAKRVIDVITVVTGLVIGAYAIRFASLARRLPAVASAALVAILVLLTFSTGFVADVGCPAIPSPLWIGPTVALIPITVLALLAKQAWWVLVAFGGQVLAIILVGLVTAGPGTACTPLQLIDGRTNMLTCLIWFGLRVVMEKQFRAAHRQLQATRRTETLAILDRAFVESANQPLKVVTAHIRPFFISIIDREIDPRSIGARRQARAIENFARQILELPRLPESAEAAALQWIFLAQSRGINLELALIENSFALWSEDAIAECSLLLNQLLETCSRGDCVVASLTNEQTQLLLVLTSESAALAFHEDSLAVAAERYDDQLAVTVRPAQLITPVGARHVVPRENAFAQVDG